MVLGVVYFWNFVGEVNDLVKKKKNEIGFVGN